MLNEIGGTFVKIAWADDADIRLKRGLLDRPAACFDRVGQDALHLSPDEESACLAIGQYLQAGDAQRLLLIRDFERCALLDRHYPKSFDI